MVGKVMEKKELNDLKTNLFKKEYKLIKIHPSLWAFNYHQFFFFRILK